MDACQATSTACEHYIVRGVRLAWSCFLQVVGRTAASGDGFVQRVVAPMQICTSSSSAFNVAVAEQTTADFERTLMHLTRSFQPAVTGCYNSRNAPSFLPLTMTVGPVYPAPCCLRTGSVSLSQQLGSACMYPPSPISPAWATHSEPSPVPPFPPPLQHAPYHRVRPLQHIPSSHLHQRSLTHIHQVFPADLHQILPTHQGSSANVRQVSSTHLHHQAAPVMDPASYSQASAHILRAPAAHMHVAQLQHVTCALAHRYRRLCPPHLSFTPQTPATAPPQCQSCSAPLSFQHVYRVRPSTKCAQQQLVSRAPVLPKLQIQFQRPQCCEPFFTQKQLCHANSARVLQYRSVQQQRYTHTATLPTSFELQASQADHEEPEKVQPWIPLQMPYVMASSDSAPTGSEKVCQKDLNAEGLSVGGAESEGEGQLDIELLGGEEEVETQGMCLPAGLDPQQIRDLGDYRDFATKLKSHREQLGYTQAHVAQQVGLRYGIALAPDSIADFELARVSLEDARRLRPTLEQWIKDTAKAAGISMEETGVSPVLSMHSRERRRRTVTTTVVREHLEREFLRKKKPTQEEMAEMARHLSIEKEFVRIWFCNRRQRQKKRDTRAEDIATTTVTVPSPSHDITMEVPVEGHTRAVGDSIPVYIMEERKEEETVFLSSQ